jgi:hypothetical protein
MNNKILAIFSVAIFATQTLATPALAGDDVILPKGDLNGASSNCQGGAKFVKLVSGNRSWKLGLGKRLVKKTRVDQDWNIICKFEYGSSSIGTGCFYKGYVVAGYEPDAVRVACYEGPIPANLK